ncbi:hypothetical protein SASPL_128651 [Salvia splendens]|uniref:Uncharacterized protein n=1 Tax=Salvia splendens TaxID=180675 RepID=A0A8X8XDK7_SALSN|nr:hypothetical protein SASPL_128651 [Salvia splendens]
MDNKEHIEKFKKYEAESKQYLMSKYFSDKTIFGGNIFDVKMNIDGQTITASRLPPYQSYLDPATFDEMINKGLSSSAETPTTTIFVDHNVVLVAYVKLIVFKQTRAKLFSHKGMERRHGLYRYWTRTWFLMLKYDSFS